MAIGLRQAIAPIWRIEVFALLVALGSMLFTGVQAFLLLRQIELDNRPFVSIEDVWWGPRGGSMQTGFEMENYGAKPAAELRFLNFRAVILTLDVAGITQKVKERTPASHSRYVERQYIPDERNRLVLSIMEFLAAYLRQNPEVDQEELRNFLTQLTPTSPGIMENDIFSYQGRLLFNLHEVNNDMDEYRRRQRFIAFPRQVRSEFLGQQMGEGGLRSVLEGNRVLIIFWALQYNDIQRDMEYASFYLGYGLYDLPGIDIGQVKKCLIQEFQSWATDTPLRNWLARLRTLFT